MKSLSKNIFGIFTLVVVAGFCLPAGMAHAQDVELDEEGLEDAEPDAMWGIGVRLRQVRMPESVIELFVEDAPGGGTHVGYGFEIIRQKGNFTLSLGLEYEELSATNGIWIDKGDSIPQDPVDDVRFNNFGWVGADLSFVWQAGLIKDVLFLRYGAGLGVGLLRGEILQTDYLCTTDQTSSCTQDPNAMNINSPANLPPVFPIVNVVVGAQIRPVKYLAINLEGGIRTVPFIGTTVAFMY